MATWPPLGGSFSGFYGWFSGSLVLRSLNQKGFPSWDRNILNHQNQGSLWLKPIEALLQLPAHCCFCQPGSRGRQEFTGLALVQLHRLIFLDDAAEDTVLLQVSQLVRVVTFFGGWFKSNSGSDYWYWFWGPLIETMKWNQWPVTPQSFSSSKAPSGFFEVLW